MRVRLADTFGRGRVKRRYHFGTTFGLFCLIAILIALLAMSTGINLLLWIFGVMASAIIVGGMVSGSMMMHVRVRRSAVGRPVAGEPLLLRYAVRNTSRYLPAFGLECSEEAGRGPHDWSRFWSTSPAWIMHVGPRETVHGEAVVIPERRGEVRLGRVRIASAFPFGILRKSLSVPLPRRVLVLPRAWRLRSDVLHTLAPRGAAGMRLSRRSGDGEDFYGLREFRHGDPIRRVAWKRTANRDQLLVTERTRPNPPRVRVAVNLTVPTDELNVSADEPHDARALEEAAISLAASIVHAADAAGYEIGLSVLGFDTPPIPVRRSQRHRDRMLAELARIDLDLPRTGEIAMPRVEREGAGLVVVHPARIDLGLVTEQAAHFSARQLDQLVEQSRPVTSGTAAATTTASSGAVTGGANDTNDPNGRDGDAGGPSEHGAGPRAGSERRGWGSRWSQRASRLGRRAARSEPRSGRG